jgi:hypothetical protein
VHTEVSVQWVATMDPVLKDPAIPIHTQEIMECITISHDRFPNLYMACTTDSMLR